MGIDDAWILTLNAGSSSLKFAAYRLHSDEIITSGQIASISNNTTMVVDGVVEPSMATDHTTAVRDVLQALAKHPDLGPDPAIIGHRIVHGGDMRSAVEITPAVRDKIIATCDLAPLHNPPALAVIEALNYISADYRQIACFDTTFHADNSAEATTLPIPQELREKGIRRYGFHGLSYASLVRRFADATGAELPSRTLAFHLGAGASLAAIVDGKGVATTMGFSPMDGLVMATRAGAMDPGVILHLMRSEGMDADDIDTLLNRQSGLTALSGGNADMKSLLDANDPTSKFAVSHYCYWVSRHAGSMIAAMQGVDGFVFTGGVGENATEVRNHILDLLSWTGAVPHWVVPADEEGEIAHAARRILSKDIG